MMRHFYVLWILILAVLPSYAFQQQPESPPPVDTGTGGTAGPPIDPNSPAGPPADSSSPEPHDSGDISVTAVDTTDVIAGDESDLYPARKGFVEGLITAIDVKTKSLTVNTRDGETTLVWDEETAFRPRSKRRSALDLKIGDNVSVKYITVQHQKKATKVKLRTASSGTN